MHCTENPIYVFSEMKLFGLMPIPTFMLFPKQNSNALPPNFHIHVSVSDLCIPRISLLIWQPDGQTGPGNI